MSPPERGGPLLRKLLVLERAQTALGIALLVAIALRAVVAARDDAPWSALVIAGVGSLLVFTLVFRVRLGRESLRRDVRALELPHEVIARRRPRTTPRLPRVSRSRLLRPIRIAVTRLRRAVASRRRRWLRLQARSRLAHAREHGLGRR